MNQFTSPPAGNNARSSLLHGRETIGICFLLVSLVLLVFGQTVGHDFINFDDDQYVYNAPMVSRGLSFEGIGWAFTHVHAGNWHPLTTISHMLDCQVYGLWAGGHHLTNALLQAAVAVLLFLMLREMTGGLWRCGFVAAVFAVHPLRVESVAWVSERKDLLSGLFFMLILWAYARYVRRPASRGWYALIVVSFALGLLSKPMLVTVPFILLLLDYWPLGRFQHSSQILRLLIEKLPLFALSALSCVATIFAQHTAIQPLERFSIASRFGNAFVACVVYLGKLIFPVGLAILYPLTENQWADWQVVAAILLLGAATVWAVLLRRKQPYFLVGWFWYLGMLAPVIGILQVGTQAYADRYTYLPQIGLLIAATWALADWAGQWRHRRTLLGSLAALVLCVLTVKAWHQTSYWRDSKTLWIHTLGCTRDNYIGHFNLGNAVLLLGQNEEAAVQYRETLRINPVYAEARNNLALVLHRQGRIEEAVALYREALRLKPDYPEAHYNLGNSLLQQGKSKDAITEYREALRIKPEYPDACFNLGNVALREGKTEEAIARYHEALRLNPNYPEVHNNLGIVLHGQGRNEEAIARYRAALRINPAYVEAHFNLGNVLLEQGQNQEAIAEYREVLRLKPTYPDGHFKLANALLQQGQNVEAIAEYVKALAVNPAHAEAHNNLGIVLRRRKRNEEAIAQYHEALRINPAYAEAHYNLGNALIDQGNKQEAIAQYRQALQTNPGYAEAHLNLGNALFEQAEAVEAITHAQKALELQPANVAIQNSLAWMLATAPQASLRNGTKALELAIQANQSSGGKNPLILRTLAAAYAQTGDFPHAIQTAHTALELVQPDSFLAGTLLRGLKLYEAGRPFEDVR